jgi:hypothetical protein
VERKARGLEEKLPAKDEEGQGGGSEVDNGGTVKPPDKQAGKTIDGT